jgi:hypothetical protein
MSVSLAYLQSCAQSSGYAVNSLFEEKGRPETDISGSWK